MADSEKEKLFQKHSQRVQEQVDAIVKQKERIRKQEEADRAFSEKVAKAGGWGGMASGQKMRLLETSLWKMEEDLIDRVEQAQRDLVDMDYIRKIWKIRDKAKNSTSVRNAKFKVGDKVTDGVAVYLITGKDDGYYEWKVIRGKANPEYSVGGEFGWAEGKMRLANSRILNSVRGNTKLKNIDYWFADNGYGDDTLSKYVQSYKKNKCIDFVDRHADTAARDAFYDAMYELTGVKSRWALNSRACNSSNVWVIKTPKGYFRVPGVPTYTPKVELATHYISESAAKQDAKRRLATSIEWKVVQEVSNSCAINSTNSVVAKALNSKVAMNASLRKIYKDVQQATSSMRMISLMV